MLSGSARHVVHGLALFAGMSALSSSAYGVFLDGKGNYSLRGETRTHPGYDSATGQHQAIEQNFRLDGEIRANDKASFFLQFRLFDTNREAYLGDDVQPQECAPQIPEPNATDDAVIPNNRGNSRSCAGRHQNGGEPGYAPYTPRITEAYAQYAFNSCLFKAGRRSRDWGMGMFLSSGKGAFDKSMSLYDGFECAINIQKAQTLGFSVGYDKLSETGAPITDQGSRDTYGANKPSDDLDQFFFTIQYDDRKAAAGSAMTQQIGIYFANVIGGGDLKTDIKYADLFLNFSFPNLVLKNEILFRLGKSADPSWARLGGVYSIDESIETNKLDSIAATGGLEYYLSRSGMVVGPNEFRQGDAKSHSMFLGYAYAPGDSDGYYDVYDYSTPDIPLKRNTKVNAFAFHRNFKPALLLFNAPTYMDSQRIDGIYDPTRLMNATVYDIGYRYRSLENGDFEVKFITASLNQGAPADFDRSSGTYPVGTDGKELGYELDLKYDRYFGKEFSIGAAGGIGLPGDAMRTQDGKKPQVSYLIESHVSFNF